MTLWKNLVVALVAAFALAACSSSDNDSANMPTEPPAEGPTQDQVDALEKDKAEAEAEAEAQKKRADELQAEKEKAAMEVGAAHAKALLNALGSGSNTFSSTTFDSDELEKGILKWTTPMPEHDYDYDSMDNKRGSVGQLLRTKVYTGADEPVVEHAPGDAGYYLISDTNLDVDTYQPFIDSDAFKNSGDTTYKIQREGQARRFPGTFDGAAGTYVCTGGVNTDCTARKLDGDGYSFVAGEWEFQLSSNDVKTVEPDKQYLVWAWWTRTSPAGMVAFGSFVAPQGGLDPLGDIPTGLAGKATYNGMALGQYALYDPLPGQVKESGKFTANAELKATFGETTDQLSGMLSGFMTESGEKDWTVELRKTAITAGTVNSTFNADSASTAGTVWEIDEEAADAGGFWDAQFYDETLDDVPGTTPTDVAGTFRAMYDATGVMAGAFSAEHDTK